MSETTTTTEIDIPRPTSGDVLERILARGEREIAPGATLMESGT